MTLPNELHPGFFSAAGGGDVGDPIDQSLRFKDRNDYLEKTSYTCPTTFTLSCWFKLSETSGDPFALLSQNNDPGGASGGLGPVIWIYSQRLGYYTHSGSVVATSARFRDTSAWYHAVVQQTATTYTAWMNGQQVLNGSRSFSGSTSGNFHIKRNFNNWLDEQGGYLAEYHFLEAQALSATDFGRYNEDGIWVPVKTEFSTAQYGSKGFHLTFDSSQANGIGHDSSGQNNHFTASGINTTSTTRVYSNDVFGDTSTTYDSTNTNKVFLNGSQFGPRHMFEGDLVNDSCKSGTGQAQTWIYWRPDPPLSISSSLVVHCSNTADVRINGTSTGQTNDGTLSNFPINIANPPATLTELAIQGNSISSATIYGVVVDGTTLTDPLDNDVDFLDTPTSNYATGNPLDALTQSTPNFTYTKANLEGTGTQNGLYHGLAGFTISLNDTNNYYWEIETTATTANDYPNLVLYQCWEANNTNWTDKLFIWYRDGQRYWDGTTTAGVLPSWNINDICGMRFDGSNDTVYCSVNGGTETAYTLPSRLRDIRPGYLCPPQNSARVTLNFGQRPFSYQPANSVAMQTNNPPNPTIKDGSDHFRAIIAGPTTTVDSGEIGGDFSPYVTSNTGAWYGTAVPAGMFDGTLSGYTQTNDASGTSTITFTPATPIPYTSSVEIYYGGASVSLNGGASQSPTVNQWSSIASGSGTITSIVFTGGYGGTVHGIRVDGNVLVDQGPLVSAQAAFPTGFYWIKDRDNSSTQHQLVDTIRGTNIAKIIPQNGAQTSYSAPTGSSVAWCWKSGAASKNGFNMFQYTGNSSSTQAIAHGLPGTPEFIISFSQSANSGMSVHHTKLPSGEALNLDSSAAPTSSTRYSSVDATNITFGGDYNTDGENYMCYAWTSIDAYSRIDSYKGNQSADGPFIYLGFKPSWILLKRGDIANWRIFDSSRNQTNPMDLMLWPNLSDAEGTDPYGSGDVVDFLSNGFKIRATGTTMNASNDHIYYVAFAESPFGGKNVPPATGR